MPRKMRRQEPPAVPEAEVKESTLKPEFKDPNWVPPWDHETHYRFRCPLCGMLPATFMGYHRDNIDRMEQSPFPFEVYRQRFSGWGGRDPGTNKREGFMQYTRIGADAEPEDMGKYQEILDKLIAAVPGVSDYLQSVASPVGPTGLKPINPPHGKKKRAETPDDIAAALDEDAFDELAFARMDEEEGPGPERIGFRRALQTIHSNPVAAERVIGELEDYADWFRERLDKETDPSTKRMLAIYHARLQRRVRDAKMFRWLMPFQQRWFMQGLNAVGRTFAPGEYRRPHSDRELLELVRQHIRENAIHHSWMGIRIGRLVKDLRTTAKRLKQSILPVLVAQGELVEYPETGPGVYTQYPEHDLSVRNIPRAGFYVPGTEIRSLTLDEELQVKAIKENYPDWDYYPPKTYWDNDFQEWRTKRRMTPVLPPKLEDWYAAWWKARYDEKGEDYGVVRSIQYPGSPRAYVTSEISIKERSFERIRDSVLKTALESPDFEFDLQWFRRWHGNGTAVLAAVAAMQEDGTLQPHKNKQGRWRVNATKAAPLLNAFASPEKVLQKEESPWRTAHGQSVYRRIKTALSSRYAMPKVTARLLQDIYHIREADMPELIERLTLDKILHPVQAEEVDGEPVYGTAVGFGVRYPDEYQVPPASDEPRPALPDDPFYQTDRFARLLYYALTMLQVVYRPSEITFRWFQGLRGAVRMTDREVELLWQYLLHTGYLEDAAEEDVNGEPLYTVWLVPLPPLNQ